MMMTTISLPKREFNYVIILLLKISVTNDDLVHEAKIILSLLLSFNAQFSGWDNIVSVSFSWDYPPRYFLLF